MLLIPCPWCGPRNQIEFTYGGDATVRRPAPEAPEAMAMQRMATADSSGWGCTGATTSAAKPLNTTSDITRGFISATKSPRSR